MITNLLTEDNLPSYHRQAAEHSLSTAPGERGSAVGLPKKPGTASFCVTISSSHAAWIPSRWSAPGWNI